MAQEYAMFGARNGIHVECNIIATGKRRCAGALKAKVPGGDSFGQCRGSQSWPGLWNPPGCFFLSEALRGFILDCRKENGTGDWDVFGLSVI